MRGEHLPCDLGVAGFVRADEAELIAAEVGDVAEEKQEEADAEEDDDFAGSFDEGMVKETAKPCRERMGLPFTVA
jgi:hypothetical protein